MLIGALMCAGQTVSADIVTDWNNIAVNATQTAGVNSLLQTRVLAMVHVAIYQAVNAVNRQQQNDSTASGKAAQAAAASAAHDVLVTIYPAQQSAIANALSESLKKLPDSQVKTAGLAIGVKAAEEILKQRANDGLNTNVDYSPGSGVGIWQPTPPAFAPMVLPQFAKLKPFALMNAEQFPSPAPAALDSAQFAKDFNEIKRVGAKDSSVRSADQTAAAIFWTINTPVVWNAAARAAVAARATSLSDSARLFALLNMAGTDAYVAAWTIKEKFDFWRPMTAIRNAASLGNKALTADPNWEPLIVTPAHPDYPSAHCVYSGAAEQVLRDFFGDDKVAVSVTNPPNVGVTRTYTTFSAISEDVLGARIWGGIHYRTADEQGLSLGHKIGTYTMQSLLESNTAKVVNRIDAVGK